VGQTSGDHQDNQQSSHTVCKLCILILRPWLEAAFMARCPRHQGKAAFIHHTTCRRQRRVDGRPPITNKSPVPRTKCSPFRNPSPPSIPPRRLFCPCHFHLMKVIDAGYSTNGPRNLPHRVCRHRLWSPTIKRRVVRPDRIATCRSNGPYSNLVFRQ
jgi:hypothetical protein